LLETYVFALPLNFSDNYLPFLFSAEAPANLSSNNITQSRRITSSIKIPTKVASPVPTYEFLSTLNIFAAALVSDYCNLRALHAKRTAFMLRKGKPSKAVTLPSIYIRLEELIPSKGRSARTGQKWARDVVRLSFQGLELLPQKPSNAVTPASPRNQAPSEVAPQRPIFQESAVMITEARMIIPKPNALVNINERVDRDIAFDAESGSFAFRLRSRVGESVIPELVERLIRVERLVEFIQVLQKHESALKCQTVSLGKIIFTYGNISPNSGSDAMDLDSTSHLYKATVDFSTVENTMALILERENPHLRIADHLGKVLNGTEGLDGVATLLPLTLPVLHGLDAIEAAWTPSQYTEKGEVFMNVRAVDWYIIRYNLKQTSPTPNLSPRVRKIMFEVRLRQRRGDPWWYIRRTDNSRNKETDDIDEAIKPLWSAKGAGWQGMRVSGVAQAGGVEELLEKIDEIVRNLPVGEFEASVAIPAVVPASAPPKQTRPQGPQQQQRQQQPTPNQSQNQGRNNPMKREIVEID
jgi:mediator of RNA polymerase II transcription subunit 14